MSPESGIRDSARADAGGPAVVAAALLAAVVLSVAFTAVTRTIVIPTGVQVAGSHLVVWIPLGVAIAGSLRRNTIGWRRLLRVTPLDLLWGVGVGLLVRATVTLGQLGLTGSMPGNGIRIELDPLAWWIGLIVAPVLLAPLVEEVFFRGLTQATVTDAALAAGTRSRPAAVTGVVIAAAVFGLLHTLDAATLTGAWIVGLGAFVLGCATGALVALTGRIGGAVIAHGVFNLTLALLIT